MNVGRGHDVDVINVRFLYWITAVVAKGEFSRRSFCFGFNHAFKTGVSQGQSWEPCRAVVVLVLP